MNPRALLHNEPHLLLLEELREPRNYFPILQAIARGDTRRNRIAKASHLPLPTVGKYLDVLRGLDIVERRVPVTETRPDKSRKGIYWIKDSFLRFWFRFVHPFQDRLELGWVDTVMEEEVRPYLNQFVADAFEQVAHQRVARWATQGRLPFSPTRMGSWWSPNGEIYLVAFNEKTGELLLGEYKWTEREVGENILSDLKGKAKRFHGGPWNRVV